MPWTSSWEPFTEPASELLVAPTRDDALTPLAWKVKREEENRKKLLGDRKKKDGPDDETQAQEEMFLSRNGPCACVIYAICYISVCRAWCGRIGLSETPPLPLTKSWSRQAPSSETSSGSQRWLQKFPGGAALLGS